jgi:ABC-type oligopeptide transport system substrate-binding subunit
MKWNFLKKHVLSVLVVVVFAFLAAGCGESGSSSSSSSSSQKYLNAVVNFSDTQLKITNNDTYDWTDTKIVINDKYVLKAGTIKAGGVYIVGMAQFAKSDGLRFNPFTTKLVNILISSNGLYYYGQSK